MGFDDLLFNDNLDKSEFSIEDLGEFDKSPEDDMLNFDDDYKLFMNDNDVDDVNYQEDINKMLKDEFDVNDILGELKENKTGKIEDMNIKYDEDLEELIEPENTNHTKNK